jgi:cytochrome c553
MQHEMDTGRVRKAPENFLDQDGIQLAAQEARQGRRDFLRGAFAAAAAGAAGAAAAAPAPADGDPAILQLPEHSRGLGQPVATEGYGKPSKHEANVQRRTSPGLTQTRQASVYEAGKRLFFMRAGPHDFSCASCHGQDDKRIRLQDLPNLTRNPGDGVGFAAWPAYRVSNGQMWTMQMRLNDCYRQQRFPEPEFGSDALTALSTYLGVNANGAKSAAPALKR